MIEKWITNNQILCKKVFNETNFSYLVITLKVKVLKYLKF